MPQLENIEAIEKRLWSAAGLNNFRFAALLTEAHVNTRSYSF